MSIDSPVLLADPRREYEELKDSIDAAIGRVLSRGVFTPDLEVAQFELEVARWVGMDHAIGVSSGSAALLLSLRALGIGPGDEIVTTANLDISPVAPITRAGATPVFVDVDRSTHTMSPRDLERKITDRTKAVLVVHSHGNPAAMPELLAVADHSGVPIVEDATTAPGAWVGPKRVGSLGTIGCFSFAPTKPLGGFGNAGVVLTRSDGIAKRIRVDANYGFRSESVSAIRSGEPLATFEYELAGINASMDELQAAVLRVKLSIVDEWADRRRSHATIYESALVETMKGRVQRLEQNAGARWSPRSFVIEHPERDLIAQHLARSGVRTALHYVPPLHVQAPYGTLDRVGRLPITERAAAELLCIPVGPQLTPTEVRHVADVMCEVLKGLS